MFNIKSQNPLQADFQSINHEIHPLGADGSISELNPVSYEHYLVVRIVGEDQKSFPLSVSWNQLNKAPDNHEFTQGLRLLAETLETIFSVEVR